MFIDLYETGHAQGRGSTMEFRRHLTYQLPSRHGSAEGPAAGPTFVPGDTPGRISLDIHVRFMYNIYLILEERMISDKPQTMRRWLGRETGTPRHYREPLSRLPLLSGSSVIPRVGRQKPVLSHPGLGERGGGRRFRMAGQSESCETKPNPRGARRTGAWYAPHELKAFPDVLYKQTQFGPGEGTGGTKRAKQSQFAPHGEGSVGQAPPCRWAPLRQTNPISAGSGGPSVRNKPNSGRTGLMLSNLCKRSYGNSDAFRAPRKQSQFPSGGVEPGDRGIIAGGVLPVFRAHFGRLGTLIYER